jgi:hypothetical protein
MEEPVLIYVEVHVVEFSNVASQESGHDLEFEYPSVRLANSIQFGQFFEGFRVPGLDEVEQWRYHIPVLGCQFFDRVAYMLVHEVAFRSLVKLNAFHFCLVLGTILFHLYSTHWQ